MSEENGLIGLKNKQRLIERQRKIKIDANKTQYPLIRNVAVTEIGWTPWGRQDQKGDANIFWSDTYVSQQSIKRIKPYQRINHFPNSQQLGKKNLLSENIKRFKTSFPNEYNFYPQTWILPQQADSLSTYQQECLQKQNKKKWFIVKPSASSQGKGIYLTKDIQLSCKQPKIVQQYILNPLLIQNFKFDLRIYVLIKSLFPLKIFRYQEGLARLSTTPYQNPNKNNKTNLNIHLTNYSINKWNPSFIQNKNIQQTDIGHKRSLQAIFKYLKTIGCDNQKLQSEIDQIIVKTILSAYPKLSQSYKQCRDTEVQTQSVCFQILGFDVIIDSTLKPWLLQVNHSPSFCTESPLDFVVKKYLILDTLILLNLNAEQKQMYLKYKPKDKDSNVKDKDLIRIKRSAEQVYEQAHLGGYQKIYPTTKPIYAIILKKMTQKKYKHAYKKNVQVKYDIDSNETEGSNPIPHHRKRNAMTFYGHFQQIKRQVKQDPINNKNEQQELQRHIFLQRQRKKFIQPIKLHNINIKFFKETKTYFNRGFYTKRAIYDEKSNQSPHNPSRSLIFQPKTADGGRDQVKKLDHQIRTRVEKMKLARIKIHKIRNKQSTERKLEYFSHRIMTKPLKSQIKQVRGQNKYI